MGVVVDVDVFGVGYGLALSDISCNRVRRGEALRAMALRYIERGEMRPHQIQLFLKGYAYALEPK